MILEQLGIKKLLLLFPFVAMTEGGLPHLNVARVIEAVIIASVAGMLSAYVTMREIDAKVQGLTQMVEKIDSRIYDHRIWHLERAEQHEQLVDHPKGVK